MQKSANSRRFRSRKMVFWTTVAMLVLHGGLSFWTIVQSPFYEDKEFQDRFATYRTRWTAARSERRKIMVVVGSSRLEWGLKARLVEKSLANQDASAPAVHNLGFVGSGPLLDWAIVRRLLSSAAPPDYVALEINPMFCKTRDGAPYETPRLVHEKLFSVERLQLAQLGWKHGDPPKWSLDELVPAWYRTRGELIEPLRPKSLVARKLKPAPARVDDWGDCTAVAGAPHSPGAIKVAHRDYFESLQNLNFDPTALAALNDIVEKCHAKHIPVALLLMPESDHFRSWYGANAEAALAEALDHFRDQWGMACFDARSWLPDVREYYDSHHLLDAGADVFSRRFADECVLPWIRGTPTPAATKPFQTTSFPKTKDR